MVEISKVIVTTVVTDLGNGFFSFNKHLGSNANANPFHVLTESAVGLFLKVPAK